MNSSKLLNCITIALITNILTSLATAQGLELSDSDSEFIRRNSVTMFVINDTYTHCFLEVIPGDKKILEEKNAWTNKYWPASIEIMHYSSKILAELKAKADNVDIDQIDEFAIGNQLGGIATARMLGQFEGKDAETQKQLCRGLASASSGYSKSVLLSYKKLKKEYLVAMYGDYDGAEIYREIQKSLN